MSLHILDTDILSLLQHNHPEVSRRVLSADPADLAVTIITVEEQVTGWLSALRRVRLPKDIAAIYERLTRTVESLVRLQVLTYSEQAVHRYNALAALKLHVGKMDLRIAAIALENNATVISRNRRDFGRVPGLVVDDWSV